MPFTYQVQMQREDGQIIQADYTVNWSPDKFGADDVANACAAEYSCKKPQMKHHGLTAVLQNAVA